MELKTYVKQLTTQQRAKFCIAAGIPDTYLSSMISDREDSRKAGAKTIFFLIAASKGVLTMASIRPDLAEKLDEHIAELGQLQ